MIDIALDWLNVGVWNFFPALDWKKEILLHLWPGVVHAIAHFDVCVFRMQINFQRFLLNRNVGFVILVRGAGATGSRDARLPGAAISQECADSDNKRCGPER